MKIIIFEHNDVYKENLEANITSSFNLRTMLNLKTISEISEYL